MLKTSHMQEMKRRYASMYIPAETVDDQFNEHCGVCDEQGIEEAVLNEALKPRDKAVIDAFYSRKGNLASNLLSVEGGKLTKMGMGGQEIAIWKNDKIVINAKMDVKSTEEIVRYMKKSIPSGVFEEVEIEESNELQAIMALDDVGIEASINKKDQVVVKKKDLKKAEAALKKSFRKGGAPELHGEEVEIDEKFNKKKFDDNEDKNDHTGNGVELVNMFGTTSEKKTMAQIQKNHDKNGEISRKDQSTRDAMVKKYYPKLEEVELDERAKGDSIEGPAKGKKHKCPAYVKKEGYGYGKNISHSLSENRVDKMNIYWYDSKEVSFMMPTSEVEIVTEGMHSEEGHTEKFKSTKKIAEELRKLPNPFENIQEDGKGVHDPIDSEEKLEVGSHPDWPAQTKKKKKKVMEKRSVSFARKFYQKGEK